ncbi:MAG: hypothetical protein ACM3L5_00115 [Candidatus Saccharibacteria bacterium]
MSPNRGIKVTVFLFVLVLATFAALTFLLPDLNEEVSTAGVNAQGTVNVSDSEFSDWLNSTYVNLSAVVAQIQSSGMGMGNTTELDKQLQAMSANYAAELDNMTVTEGAVKAKAEFKAALEDYQQATKSRLEGGGMSKMGTTMEYFLKASIHANNALKEMADHTS